MNERIRELARQTNMIYELSDGTITQCSPNIEKFVELIVEECQIAVVSRLDCSAVEAIKEHFYGVKE